MHLWVVNPAVRLRILAVFPRMFILLSVLSFRENTAVPVCQLETLHTCIVQGENQKVDGVIGHFYW